MWLHGCSSEVEACNCLSVAITELKGGLCEIRSKIACILYSIVEGCSGKLLSWRPSVKFGSGHFENVDLSE